MHNAHPSIRGIHPPNHHVKQSRNAVIKATNNTFDPPLHLAILHFPREPSFAGGYKHTGNAQAAMEGRGWRTKIAQEKKSKAKDALLAADASVVYKRQSSKFRRGIQRHP
jgi:hypothetical protein